MAASGATFESAKDIHDKRESKRMAREKELQRAKDAFEKQEKLKEQKRLRGEDTWMLTDVNERLDQLAQEHSGKKKKKKEKHSKKAKKEKKQKSKKQKLEKSDECTDSSSESENEWVESTPVSKSGGTQKAWQIKTDQSDTEATAAVQRDEWMTLDFMSMKTTSVACIRAEKQKEKEAELEKAQAIEQANALSRELNPYWKDGGMGLPPEEGDTTSVKKAVLVEDGGLSWLRKSYQRMKEQSEREKRNLDEIIATRYGSVEIFQAKMEEAEKQSSARCGDRNYRNEDRRTGWRKPNYSITESSETGRREENAGTIKGDSGDRHGNSFRARSSYCDIPQENDGRKRLEDRLRRDEGEYGKSKTEPYRRGHDSRAATEGCDRKSRLEWSSTSGGLKAKFLRPSDDEGLGCDQKSRVGLSTSGGHKAKFIRPSEDEGFSYKSRAKDTEREESSLSKGFRKPVEDSGGDPPWSRGETKARIGREGSHRQPQAPKKTALVLERTPKEEKCNAGGEGLKASPDKKEQSPVTKSSVSRLESDAEPIRVLTEDEMNKLGAKLVKAELMGNTDLASKLKDQLEKARELRTSQAQVPPNISTKKTEPVSTRLQEDNEVLLVRTDQSGRAWPVNVSEPPESKGGRRKRHMVETHEDKERVRYFRDDDNQSLQDLVRKEKMGTAEDQNKLFMRMASKFMEKTDKEYYTLDDMFVSKTARKESADKEDEREREQAISEHRKLAARMEKCPYCFDNPELPKHLIVAIGKKVYVCLPNYLSLTDGHCLIAPLQHYHAATLLDEDIWEEIQMFRKALVKMFESNGLDCVFLETNLDMKKRYHMVYECIPLPKEVGDMAPIYFKKAIMESDEEWSMNKKLIDLSSRDVRKSVPKGLPYFSVDFGLQGGYAHVIEDQHKFPHYFGKEIIGGMLDLEPRIWRKAIRENFDDQRKKVLQFAQWWKPYDFTKTKD